MMKTPLDFKEIFLQLYVTFGQMLVGVKGLLLVRFQRDQGKNSLAFSKTLESSYYEEEILEERAENPGFFRQAISGFYASHKTT